MSSLQLLIQIDQHVDRPPRGRDHGEIFGKPRRQRLGAQKRLQLAALRRLVGERKVLGDAVRERSRTGCRPPFR